MKSFLRNERGSVLVYVTMLSGVLVGMGTLAVDVSRYSTLHSQLQNAADAAALAGAHQLDNHPGSRDRARAAAHQAVRNMRDFADSDEAITISMADCAEVVVNSSCMRFLKSLPATDDEIITEDHVAAADTEARFIEVRVGGHSFEATFLGALGRDGRTSVSASAVAGNDSLVCRVPPMFLCNPSEPPGNTDPSYGLNMAGLEGRQLKIFQQGGGGIVPGNFGLLCPGDIDGDASCGAADVGMALASVQGTCQRRGFMVSKTGVDLQQVRTGINVRFDVYSPQAKDGFGDWRRQDRFYPAENVTQGGEVQGSPLSGQTRCDRQDLDADRATALGRDSCFVHGTCGGAVGNGNWDWSNYFRINHGGNGTSGWRPVGWPGSAKPTRFEVYRWEIEMNTIVQPGELISGGGGGTTEENGRPQCFRGTRPGNQYEYFPSKKRTLDLLTDRRVLPLALVNCRALGNPTGKFGFSPPEFVFAFLTEPMDDPGSSDLYVEILGPLDEESEDNLVKDVVQIYRR
ncbi:MAG TPA: pilus assembly protein TadG-related protein [Azospirillaceae bacterium]|nr:pilus assembly protein TadG-related protein [Azospirillaceae bacterium]